MRNIIIILLVVSLVSCRKFKLTGLQKELFNTYKIGDTLVFKSITTEDIKSIVITGKYNSISSEFDIPPKRLRMADVSYRDVKAPARQPGEEDPLIIYFRNDQTEGNVISFDYESFNCKVYDLGKLNQQDTLYYFNHKLIDYYEIVDTTYKYYGTDLIKIYWHRKYGIIKYDLKDGDSYVRTNMP